MPKSLYLDDLQQAVWLLEAMCESGIPYEKAMDIIKRFNEKRRPHRRNRASAQEQP